jgi:hypothetical protein
MKDLEMAAMFAQNDGMLHLRSQPGVLIPLRQANRRDTDCGFVQHGIP